jgi:lambda repressor-like predicted transcriptional regulator
MSTKNVGGKPLVPVKKSFRIKLVESDLTQRQLAEMWGISPSLLSGVLSGREKSKRVRRLVAQFIGVSVEELWR